MKKELYDKVIEKLKELPNSENILGLLQVEDENEIEGALSKLKTGKVTFEEFIKEKENQSEFDKYLGKAANTREEKLKEKFNFVKKDGGEPDPKDKGDKKDSEVYKELQKLKDQVNGYERSRVLEKKQKMANILLKENKIPSKFIKLFDFTDDAKESIEDQFKEIQGDVGEFKDKVIDDLGAHGNIPMPQAQATGKATENEINEIVKDL